MSAYHYQIESEAIGASIATIRRNMAIGNTSRKVLSVIDNIEENSRYHYPDKPFAIFRYLYFSLFRINKFLVFERDLTGDIPSYHFEPPFRMEIKSNADELREICDRHQMPRECYYADILGLDLCFLLYHGDEIALLYWVSMPGQYSRFFKLNPNTVELYYVTTLPEYRGMGLSEKISHFASHYLKQKGFHKAVVVIHESNISSIKPIVRAGFMKVRSFVSIGPLNRKYRY